MAVTKMWSVKGALKSVVDYTQVRNTKDLNILEECFGPGITDIIGYKHTCAVELST